MDRDVSLLSGELIPAHLPPRCPVPMPVQDLTPWTLPRLASAAFSWLMAETIPALPQTVTIDKRRV